MNKNLFFAKKEYIFATISDIAEKFQKKIMKLESNKKQLLFLRVNKINGWLTDVEIYPSMTDLVESIKERYARDCYWVKEREFNNDVEIPTVAPSFEEYQTEEGQKKYWNLHLSNLISLKERGMLLDKALEMIANPNASFITIYVVDIMGKEMFFMGHNEFNAEELELENITEEYLPKFLEAINTEEIESFVDTHTQDEIEEQYCSKFNKTHDRFEMWVL